MKQVMKYLVVLLLSIAAGCANLGLVTPRTFNEQLAAGYSSVTAVRNTATVLLENKKISVEDAQNVLQQTDNARAGLEIARKLAKTDLKSADSRLTAVVAGLSALQSYLATKK